MNKLKHIGVASITVPGALLCIDSIVEESYHHFGKASKIHPHITFTQPPLNEIENLLAEKDWDQVAQCLLASIEILYKAGVDFVLIPSNAPHYAIKQVQDKSRCHLECCVKAGSNQAGRDARQVQSAPMI